jgi:predicted permease
MDGTEVIQGWEDFARLMKDPARTGDADYRIASPGYFRAMGIPLVRGRLFDERDGPDAPHVAVISESLARKRWPNGDALGKLVQYGNMDGDLRLFTIVGVVGDVREIGLDAEPRPMFYGYSRQRASGLSGPLTVVLRGGGDSRALIPAARQAVRSLDPEIPARFRPLEEVFAASLADRRFSLVLLGAFAVVALALAVTGIYGVISYLVAQRTREIGIRLALGARAGDVLRMVVRRGVALALAGVVAGLLASLAGTRVLEGLLFGVSTTDAVTFVAVPLLLTLVAALASYLPARRSTRVDPMIAMRNE